MSQMDEWDQTDFDELHPSLGQSDAKKDLTVRHSKLNHHLINNPNVFAILESRFLMYDLIKITSRKSSTKIITFYFRIPLFQDYPGQVLEQSLIAQLD